MLYYFTLGSYPVSRPGWLPVVVHIEPNCVSYSAEAYPDIASGMTSHQMNACMNVECHCLLPVFLLEQKSFIIQPLLLF